jgi:hypothetical protein
MLVLNPSIFCKNQEVLKFVRNPFIFIIWGASSLISFYVDKQWILHFNNTLKSLQTWYFSWVKGTYNLIVWN